MLKNILVILFLISSFDSFAEKVTVISDTHIYGPDAFSKGCLTEKFDVSLGDIYDIKWTLKEHIGQAKKEQLEFSEKLKTDGIPEIDGNHDLKEHPNISYIKNGVLYTHGHYISWDEQKIEKKSHASRDGVSKEQQDNWGRFVKHHPYGKLSEAEKRAAVKLAKFSNCHTIVFGHTHVKKLIDTKLDGVRIINVPRGITTIDMEHPEQSKVVNECK